MHLVEKILDDNSPLSKEDLAAMRQVGRNMAKNLREIARLQEHNRRLQVAVNAISGRNLTKVRPWELVKARVLELGHPLTWDEAMDVAVVSSNIAAGLDPMKALKISVSLAKDLKCVNDLIGLAEWSDEKFERSA